MTAPPAIAKHSKPRLHSPNDAMISRVCRTFGETFAKDEATAKAEGKKYWITRMLGSGATGTVLCAKRASDGEAFAVKYVDMEGMSEADKNRAQAEVICLLNCDFFSIVKCHEDFFKKDPKNPDRNIAFCLVLDYANAGDLRQEIKSRKSKDLQFGEQEAGLLFLQVLLGVHHVHSRHMIHRDIKSANILLCSNGLVKLGDFGFSKMYSATVSDDVGRTFCGTPYYVAPEIWRRKPYSKKADMFSLGVLLYELLTLKRPFTGESTHTVMHKTVKGEYEPLPAGISPEMCDVVRRLLSPDPSDRPSSRELLSMPICKLYMSGFMEITNSHRVFSAELHTLIVRHMKRTKQELRERPDSPMQSLIASAVAGSGGVSSSSSGGGGKSSGVTLYEGAVRKFSCDLKVWKQRYLCIRADTELEEAVAGGSGSGGLSSTKRTTDGLTSQEESEGGGGGDSHNNRSKNKNNNNNPIVMNEKGTNTDARSPSPAVTATTTAAASTSCSSAVRLKNISLLLALSKDSVDKQCIVTPAARVEDVFPVPVHYTGGVPGGCGGTSEHVFAIVSEKGKRLLFQAESAEDRGRWVSALQEVMCVAHGEP